ncbi:MAG: flagellar hook-associated protein FlgL [Gammaproteobacteria bacterium]|nr:flagellar hook-associated protein FlgL [Gammaproteobacteria bacterium]
MSMRISTSQLFQLGIKSVLDQQATVSKLQQQIASGKRIQSPADDPAGAVRILDVRQAIDTTSQYQRNINLARERLAVEDSTLDSSVDVLQRVRELAIQANNDTQSPQTRAAIATEIRQRLEDLLDLANTAGANGEYIFSGFNTKTQPFAVDGAGNHVYQGDQGQRFLQVSATRQVADRDTGADVFMNLATGNGSFAVGDNTANTGSGLIDPGSVTDYAALTGDDYRIVFSNGAADPSAPADQYEILDGNGNSLATAAYTPGAAIEFDGIQTRITGAPNHGDEFNVGPSGIQDVFTTVRDLAIALEGDNGTLQSRTRLHNATSQFLMNIDQAEDKLLQTRAAVGARMNVVDTQENLNEDFTLNLSKTLSSIEDLDFAEAVSLLQQQLVGLEAAQAAFVRVQGLSLFDYLR